MAFRSTARTTLLAAATLVAVASAQAQTVYVDGSNPTASDFNIGTEVQPFKTISGAMTAYSGAGVTILVGPATYYEQVSVPVSGAAGSPYTFRATGPGVIVDGSDDFSRSALWTHATGTEFVASGVDWDAKQVFVDGVRLTASTAAPGSLPSGTFGYVAGQGLFVNLGGADPGTRQTRVARRSYAFTLSTKQFVTIEGFEITRTNDRGINLFGCSDVVVANNIVTFAGSYGIQAVGSQNLVIEGNLVTDSNFHGIGLISGTTGPSTNCIVRNNECARNAYPPQRKANGIYLSGAPANTIYGNRLHHNQDTGMQFSLGSDNCVSYNNVSYANGDHGYDHLSSSNTVHVNDVSFDNLLDGFSFEGNAPGAKVFNCISVNNGLTTNSHDLWVDAASSVGFASDYNLLWNSNGQSPAKMGLTEYATVAAFTVATGFDAHSRQADPRFANAANGDFRLLAGSPAIDAATSNAPNWPSLDAVGSGRLDDTTVLNGGAGPVPFADMGAFEYVPVTVPGADRAPVVVSPATIVVRPGWIVAFPVTASDPDGDKITSLNVVYRDLPRGSGVPFLIKNRDKTKGFFFWRAPLTIGNVTFTFVARNALEGKSVTEVQVKRYTRPGVASLEAGEPGIGVGEVALSNGYPQPTASSVDFALTLPSDESVDWGIYDAQGRQVWSETRAASAGHVTLRWSGLDMSGRRAATGVYFARVRVGETEFVRRVVRY